jgi:hypothetical protein
MKDQGGFRAMSRTRRDVLHFGWSALLASSAAGQAWANDYPTKTIKIIVAAAAGGPTDVPAGCGRRPWRACGRIVAA